MSVISIASLANAGFSEVRGKHLRYSKFTNVNNDNATRIKQQMNLSSRNGMLLLYTPAFLAGVASFWVFPGEGFRSTGLQSAVMVHFFKRMFEVLSVHKYSGSMALESAIPITLSYFLSSATMIYAQHLTMASLTPGIVLKLLQPQTPRRRG